MEAWQTYLYWYLAIGVTSASVIVIGAWLQTPRDGKFTKELMAALDQKNRGFWYCFLRDRIVPALTTLLIVLIWPVALVLGVQNFLERRRQRRPASRY